MSNNNKIEINKNGVAHRLIRTESADDYKIDKWKCFQCNSYNMIGGEKCIKCDAKAPILNDWKCLYCQTDNKAQVDVCSHCKRTSGRTQRKSLLFNKGLITGNGLTNARSWDDNGSNSMHFVIRQLRLHYNLVNDFNRRKNKNLFDFSAQSKVWMAKRVHDYENKSNTWQLWEREMRIGKFEELPKATDLSTADAEDELETENLPFIPPSKGTQTLHLSLSQVMSAAPYRSTLRTYLEENYCEENLDFLEEVERYKAKKLNLNIAQKIIDIYLKQGADKQVNVDGKTRTRAIEKLKVLKENNAEDEDYSLFDDCFDVIHNMVETDIFRRFVTSPDYIDMLATYIENILTRGELLKGAGWVNTSGYKSLHVDVIKGHRVSRQKADIFVMLTMDSKSQRSQTIFSTKSPEFNEHFEFPLSSTSQYIEINMWDEVVIGGNDFLGGIYIPIECVFPEGRLVEYYLLATKSEEPHEVMGTLQLKLSMSTKPPNMDGDNNVIEEKKQSHGIQDIVKAKVSKSKIRYQSDGFDLDLTYITDRIIAMGFPAEGTRGIYRNRMKDVQRFFITKHPNCYKIVNLCSELSYDASKFQNNVSVFAFDDHNPPPFRMIPQFLISMLKWLTQHPQNIVAIHCKAGKGRSGVMIAALLLAQQADGCFTALDALNFFAEKRTANNRAVTIPSQRRYVTYIQNFLELLRQKYEEETNSDENDNDNKDNIINNSNEKDDKNARLQYRSFQTMKALEKYTVNNIFPAKLLFLSIIRIHTIPKAVESYKTDFWVKVTCPWLETEFETSEVISVRRIHEHNMIEMKCGKLIPLNDDVKLEFFHAKTFGGKELMFQLWFNTRFIQHEYIIFPKNQLDKAVKDEKDKLYSRDLEVELYFENASLDFDDELWEPNCEDDRRYVSTTNKEVNEYMNIYPNIDEKITTNANEKRRSEALSAINDHMKNIQKMSTSSKTKSVNRRPALTSPTGVVAERRKLFERKIIKPKD